jgi:Chaperone for flagella basal body P-ring formation
MTMRRGAAKFAVGGMLALALSADAARLPERIFDAALHRQWLIERDRAHPERPARLVEVPRNRGADAFPEACVHGEAPPAVRAGMKVTLRRHAKQSEVRLSGTALEAARVGEVVRVRAGLHGAVLRGVVRGPGLVELDPGRR